MTLQQNSAKASYRVHNGLAPVRLPRALSQVLDFTSVSSISVHLTKARDEDKLEWVQTLFIDNSANTASVSVTAAITNQTLVVPPGSQAYLPILAPEPEFLFVTSGGSLVPVQFLTSAYPAMIWATASSSSSVAITSLPNGAVTEATPTMANAASVTLAASNSARKYLFIQNQSAGNIMVSLSGNVLTGIAPTATNIGMVLVPGETWEASPGLCPVGAITAYQSSGGSINTVYVATA